MLPFTLKLIWGFLIDSRMVAKRKYYLVFFGILSIVTQYLIGFGQDNMTELWLVTMLIFYNFGAAFLDATIDSVAIQ